MPFYLGQDSLGIYVKWGCQGHHYYFNVDDADSYQDALEGTYRQARAAYYYGYRPKNVNDCPGQHPYPRHPTYDQMRDAYEANAIPEQPYKRARTYHQYQRPKRQIAAPYYRPVRTAAYPRTFPSRMGY